MEGICVEVPRDKDELTESSQHPSVDVLLSAHFREKETTDRVIK